MLLAIRPSISSVLRKHLFDPATNISNLTNSLTSSTTTAPAYIIVCFGKDTTVVQTDLCGGVSDSAVDYISHTNHDLASSRATQRASNVILGMEGLVEESEERKGCIDSKWGKLRKRQEAQMYRAGRRDTVAVSERTLRGWVMEYPIMNECSHFGCILDPGTGSIRWLQRGIQEDESENNDEQ